MDTPTQTRFDKLKQRLLSGESNLLLWLLMLAPMALIAVVILLHQKPTPPPQVLGPKTTTPEIKQIAKEKEVEAPDPGKGLHVLAYTPSGEVSTDVDGIKMLFDHSMIAMTDVDPDKHPAIPMTITPAVPGTFIWYGTKGFTYRFTDKLPPATQFKVVLPASLAALDKKELEKEFSWTFNTAAPRAWLLEPTSGQYDVAVRAPVKIAFSQPVRREQVEKELKCLIWPLPAEGEEAKDPKKTDCPFAWRPSWETDKRGQEILTLKPEKEFPLNSNIEINLPAGIAPQAGDIGTAAPLNVAFATTGAFTLNQIQLTNTFPARDDEEETYLFRRPTEAEKKAAASPEPGDEAEKTEPGRVPTGDICFSFSNPIQRLSFENAVQVIPLNQAKPDPTFRIAYYYKDEAPATEEEKEAAQSPQDLPYRTGCLTADLKFNTGYEIRFVKPIQDREGQTLALKQLPAPLKIQTMHASLEGTLDITKNMLNAKNPPPLPFTSMNAELLEIRLAPCAQSADTLSSSPGQCLDAQGAPEEDQADGGEAQPTPSPGPANFYSVKKIPLPADYDRYYHGRIDLAALFPGLKPGLYDIQATFIPMSEITLKKKLKTLGVEQEKLVEVPPVVQTKRLLVTETALALKGFENQYLIWAVDIATGEPKGNLPIQVWNEGSLIATGWTDGDGLFSFLNNAVEPAYGSMYVLVDDLKAFSYLSSEDKEGITPDAFGILYERPFYIKNYFAFLHTDRPLYRPNQTVYFSGFLRGLHDGSYRLPSDVETIDVTITDPEGNNIYEESLPVGATGRFGDEWELGDDDIPRGRYQVTAKVKVLTWRGESAEQTFTQAFYVSSYKKPDFKLSFTPEKKDYVSGEPIKLTAQGSYFFGAPLANAEIEWSLRQDGFRFSPPQFPDYLFVDEEAIQKALKRVQEGSTSRYEERESYEGDGAEVAAGVYSTDSESRVEDPKVHPDRPVGPAGIGLKGRVIPAKEGNLGPDGLFTVEYTPDLQAAPTSQIYTASLSAKEWGQEISAVADLRVHRSQVYVGLKPERKVYAQGQNFAVDVVTLTPEAKAAPNQTVALQLYKRDYMTVKKRNENGSWVFESEPKDTLVSERNLTTNGEGKAVFSAAAAEGGSYRLIASARDEKNRAATAAVHVDVGGAPDAAFEMNAEDRLQLVPDKDSYQVGETAQLLVPFPTAGLRGLLTTEMGSIRSKQVVTFGPGQNTVSVPIREDYVPNVYVSLLLFRPQAGDSALMKVGLAELKVDPDKKRLNLTLNPDKEKYAPKDKVRISVRTADSSGKGVPADLIVSVADESVLRLIDYESPDLLKRFYFNRKLGVMTSENMLHYKSGDAPSELDDRKKRAKFLDTAFFTSSVRTDASGNAVIEFDLPDNITTWVAEAFAVSDSTQVGSRFVAFPTTLPVFLRPSLPRFLAVEDQAQPVLFLENPSDVPYQGTVRIDASGAVTLATAQEQPVTVEPKGRTPVSFGLNGAQSGNGKIRLSTRRGSGGAEDIVELPMPVEDRSLPSVYHAGGATLESVLEKMKIPEGMRTDRGGLTLSAGTSPMSALQQAVANLLQSPYQNGEARVSALFGLWQLSQIAGFLKTPTLPAPLAKAYLDAYRLEEKPVDAEEIKNRLAQGLSSLYGFQQGDGGFGVWKEDALPDAFLSADIARLLPNLKAAGVAVDFSVEQNLASYLKQVLARQKPLPRPPPGKPDERQFEGDSRAVLAWGLASADPAAAEPAVKSLLEMQDALGPRGLASLVLALHAMGDRIDQDEKKGLIKRLRKQVQKEKSDSGELAYWKDSQGVWDPVTATAVALRALLSTDPEDGWVNPALGFLFSKAKYGNFGGTRATRETLLALGQYGLAQHRDGGEIALTWKLGPEGGTLNLPPFSFLKWLEKFFPSSVMKTWGAAVDLTLSKPPKSAGTVFYQADLSAYYPMAQVPRVEDGLILSREFYELDDYKEEKPLQTFQLGKNYKARVTVLVPATLSQLTVEHLIPAGFEPVDFSLATSNTEAAEELADAEQMLPAYLPELFTHEETMDDRVLWYGERVYPGIFGIAHVVRAATEGVFQAPGATAQPLSDKEYFARSRSMLVTIRK